MLGFVALGTVLAVWAQRPRIVPPIFGTAGGIIILAACLTALVVAAFTRRPARRFRLALGAVTIALAAAAESLALGLFASGTGAADTGLGVVLTSGVVAMVALAFRTLRGGPV